MAEPKLLEWPSIDLHIEEWQSLMATGLELPLRFCEASLPELSKELDLPVETFVLNTVAYCCLSAFPSAVFASGVHFGTSSNPVPPSSVRSDITAKAAYNLSHSFAQKQFVTLMTTQLASCWTAFETLARDLWIATVNARPRIGVRAMGAEEEPEDDERALQQKRKIRFPFSPARLAKWGYDLTNHMGDVLAVDRFKFDRKENARKAYEAAFGKEYQNEIDAIFDARELGWLCAVRNNLVHRAGIVDDDLQRQVKRHPTLKHIQATGTNRIPIEGKLCVELVTGGCKAGVDLAKMVDGWLVRYAK